MTDQSNGDYHRETAAEQTNMDPIQIAEQLNGLIWPNMNTANKAVLQAAIHALLSPPPATVYRLPPPITEADGYRLNSSWHSGAIFRDGANWMRDEVLRMGAGVPAGWKLVPIEPTPEMLSQINLSEGWTERALIARYKALIDAAPEVKS